MGKMKELLIEMQEQGLSIDEVMSIDEHQEALEEAHYVHTMNAFVELIVVYGYDKVIGDLRTAMGNKTW
jgi:hypothetical protein